MAADRQTAFHTAQPIAVQRKGDGGSRHSATLVGNIERDYLVLSALEDIELEVGEPIVVRMLHESTVIGYESRVHSVLDAPVRMYVITYPEQVESVKLRKNERLKVFMPVSVRAIVAPELADVMLLSGMLLNISAGGCCFSSKSKVQPTARVVTGFSFPGETHVYNVRGNVLGTLAGNSAFAQRVQWLRETPDFPVLAAIERWIQQNAELALLQ